MARAPRGFLWQMSSSMPWSLPPVSQCAPPQWKTLTHQRPPVAQRDNSCPHQGKFHNRKPAVLFVVTASLLFHNLLCSFEKQEVGELREGANRETVGLHSRTFSYSYPKPTPLEGVSVFKAWIGFSFHYFKLQKGWFWNIGPDPFFYMFLFIYLFIFLFVSHPTAQPSRNPCLP